jgi:hypothetical protein
MFTSSRYVKSGYVTTVAEKEQHEGLWWVNEQCEGVSGHLHIAPHGIWLSLNGTLQTTESLPRRLIDPDLVSHNLIYGIQSNGCFFTLETCIEFKKRSPLGAGYSMQIFSVGRVYCGIYAKSLDELKFSEYRLNYTYLDDWFRNIGLSYPEEVEGGFFIGCIPSTATNPPQIRFEIQNQEATIEITSDFGWNTNSQECKIRIETIMTVFCKSPLSFAEVSSKVLDPFRDFLNLAAAHPNSVTSVSAQVEDKEIIIHSSQSEYKRQTRSSNFDHSLMLFSAKDIAEEPASYINKWFAVEQEMKDICELFFGVHYDQGAFATNRLLNVVQALEAYSRVRHGEYKICKEDHKHRSNAILESAPDEYKAWLRQALSYANNKSLKEYLIHLIEEAKPLSERLFPNPDEFSKWVVDTRNYLTHRDAEGKRRIASGDTLDLMIYSLLWLFRIHFLLEVGFTHDQCNELLKKNNVYNSLCDNPELDIPWKTGGITSA